MRKFLVLLLLASGLSVQANADTSVATAEGQAAHHVLTAGVGLAFLSNKYSQLYGGGSMGKTLDFGWLGEVGDSPFYWGLDFSLGFWSFNSQFQGATAELSRGSIGIQPLLSVVYQFDSAGGSSLYPYFGLAIGPQLYIQRNTSTNTATLSASTTSNTDVLLALLARPGVQYRLLNSFAFTFEPRFGVVGGDFLFHPQMSVALLL